MMSSSIIVRGDLSAQWSEVIGFEGLYQISDAGQVYSMRARKVMLPWTDKCGYQNIAFKVGNKRSSFLVHRLVAAAFVQNPDEKPHVNHRDLDKANNHHSNLEWVTHQENMDHFNASPKAAFKRRAGRAKHSQRSLSNDHVRNMREAYAAGLLTIPQLSRAFCIAKSSVHRIVTGATYVLD